MRPHFRSIHILYIYIKRDLMRSLVPVPLKTNFSIMFTLPVKSTGGKAASESTFKKSNSCGVSNKKGEECISGQRVTHDADPTKVEETNLRQLRDVIDHRQLLVKKKTEIPRNRIRHQRSRDVG